MDTVLKSRKIEIQGLLVSARMGVCDTERSEAQDLLIDMSFGAEHPVANLQDDISQTIDYKQVADRVGEIAAEKPRHLIETLADDIAGELVREFSLGWIELRIRKYILPNAEWVAVSIRREPNGRKPES